jgi:hypothetical protein
MQRTVSKEVGVHPIAASLHWTFIFNQRQPGLLRPVQIFQKIKEETSCTKNF